VGGDKRGNRWEKEDVIPIYNPADHSHKRIQKRSEPAVQKRRRACSEMRGVALLVEGDGPSARREDKEEAERRSVGPARASCVYLYHVASQTMRSSTWGASEKGGC